MAKKTQDKSSFHPSQLGWRQTHLGRLLMDVPLALSNLAARGQVSAAHIHITRHLPLEGARLSDLAHSAGMSKQAMGDLVTQCDAWGLVTRSPDVVDSRARIVKFTALGLDWLAAFENAVRQAEDEFKISVGKDIATVVAMGLEAYASGYGK